MANNSKSIAGSAKILGNDILNAFKERVGDEWDNFADKEQKIIERTAKRFAALSFKRLKGEDVTRDLDIINATLANYAYIESSRLHRVFWESAHQVVGIASQFLSGAILSQLRQ